MRKAAVLLLLGLPMGVASLSGCLDCTSGPPVTARGIADAGATAGLRGFGLEILLTDGPDGPPLPGAGVVVYYGGTRVSEWGGPRVEVGPDSVLVEPANATSSPEAREVLRMVTDADGRVRANVPGNRIIGVVAAKDGFTEEWVPAIASGATGGSGSVTVPLYRSEISVDMEGVWGPGGASTGTVTSSDYAWDAREVPFGNSSSANRGYAARIVEMQVAIAWSNGATAAGDLGIGVGPPADGPRYFYDGGENAGLGAQSESTTLGVATLAEHDILSAPAIMAGAATDSGFAAPFGLPYTMSVRALFDTARAAYNDCARLASEDDNAGPGASVPSVGLWGVVGALTAAALLTGTRGPRNRLR